MQLDELTSLSEDHGGIGGGHHHTSIHVPSKLVALVVIVVLSLLASALPSLSKRLSYLRIHPTIFFALKHFGTGVILSTAFVHLLQDAFASLLSLPKDSLIRKWVGLLVLSSLLSIFVVEYISMTYVERLEGVDVHHHHYPSSTSVEAMKHADEDSRGRTQERTPRSNTPNYEHTYDSALPPLPEVERDASDEEQQNGDLETNTLLQHPSGSPASHRNFNTWHARAAPQSQSQDNLNGPRSSRSYSVTYGATHSYEAMTQPPIFLHADAEPFFVGHHKYERSSTHPYHHVRGRRTPSIQSLGDAISPYIPQSDLPANRGQVTSMGEGERAGDRSRSAGRSDDYIEHIEHVHNELTAKRQIINTLVLQTGIMFHSLVIGLTLSLKNGTEFTSLVTAVIFHQLFEGLSLGVRISSLPHTVSGFDSLAFLKPLLCVLFAITPAAGIGIGLFALSTASFGVHMKLVEGVMSAISAGMLIYASCIEMLAADFIMDPQLKKSSLSSQALAILSLFLGMAGMAVLGIWH